MYLARGRSAGTPRAAFSLIEIVIVMAIIAVLVSLVAGTVSKVMMAQMASTTTDRLRMIQTSLNSQWLKVTEAAMAEPIPSAALANANFATLVGTDTNATQRERILWIKYRQMQAFPQSFDEIFNPDPLGLGVPPLVNYSAILASLNITKTLNNQAATLQLESSACLYLALTRGPNANKGLGELFGPAVAPYPYGAHTVTAFKDAWASQIVFCRWPDNSSRANPGGPQPGINNDKTDPTGLLVDQAWLSNAKAKNLFIHYFHHVGNNAKGPHTYNLQPMVISAGPDSLFGLDFVRRSLNNANRTNFFTTIVPGDEQDNLYSTLLP